MANMLSNSIQLLLRSSGNFEIIILQILQHPPRTTARFNHWLYLLSDQNLDLYTPQDLLVFILPLYLEIFLLSLTHYYRPPGFPQNPNPGGAHDYHTSIIIFFSCVNWVFTAIEHVWMQSELPGMCLAVVDVCVEYLCVIMLQKVMLFGIAVLANWIFGWRAVRDAFWAAQRGHRSQPSCSCSFQSDEFVALQVQKGPEPTSIELPLFSVFTCMRSSNLLDLGLGLIFCSYSLITAK
ncbi:MAG: hypothetical protein LQ341_002092 [Variospora aurantia]|nr:MAG: hypothetical protein LQ341_002092 [Variospora aurantia]